MVSKDTPVKEEKRLRLRPSDAGRWTTCTASPHYIMSVEDQLPIEVRDYTDEGSRAHALAEQMLTGQETQCDDEQMVEYVQSFVDHVSKKIGKDSELLVETQVGCYYHPKQRGFIDAAVISPDSKKVYIDDLKYGMGVSVQARYNKQLAIYARSFMDAYTELYAFTDKTLVTMSIFQPRVAGEDAVRLWVMTYEELKQWTDDYITEVALDILSNPEDQAFAPSEDNCRFCPAAAICKERMDYLLTGLEAIECKDSILRDDEPFHPPAPESLSDHQITGILGADKELTKWLKQVREYATDRVYNGKMVLPGYKTVAARKHRKWSSEEDALKVLRSMNFKVPEITTSKIITPPNVEKLLKTRKRVTKKKLNEINSLIIQPDGAPTLVQDKDKRPALVLNIEEEFEEIITEDDIL